MTVLNPALKRREEWHIITTPHFLTPWAAQGEEAEKLGMKSSLGRKGGMEGRFLDLSLSYSIIDIKLFSISQVCFAHDGTCRVIFQSFSQLTSFLILFFPLGLFKRSQSLVGT